MCSSFVLMERKHQLSNVAFGGAWSEQIAAREAMTAAFDTLRHAAGRAGSHDPRIDPAVCEALVTTCNAHPKGQLLSTAWKRAAGISVRELRIAELNRIIVLLAEAHAERR